MKDIPNCKICQLKCYGCAGYNTCLMRKGVNGYKIEECSLIASKYYLFDNYLENFSMQLCNYGEVCKSLAEAWLESVDSTDKLFSGLFNRK